MVPKVFFKYFQSKIGLKKWGFRSKKLKPDFLATIVARIWATSNDILFDLKKKQFGARDMQQKKIRA
jgi:hypothetical protein